MMKEAILATTLSVAVSSAAIAQQQQSTSPFRVIAQQTATIGKLYGDLSGLQAALINADDALKDADATQDELQDALGGVE